MVVISKELLVLLVVVLCSPFAVILPSILRDVYAPFPQGDSSWVMIGPLVYAYGIMIASVISVIGVLVGLLVQTSGVVIATYLVTIISIIVFVYVSVTSAIVAHRKQKSYNEALERAESEDKIIQPENADSETEDI